MTPSLTQRLGTPVHSSLLDKVHPGFMDKLIQAIEANSLEFDSIVKELEEVLASERFVSAPQMSAFLRYVVEQTISGNEHRIKAYSVAVDALGKPTDFDPQNDPLVRVLAGRLRTALDNYYRDSPNKKIKIQMHRGSYIPAFIQLDELKGNGDADVSEPSKSAERETSQNNSKPVLAKPLAEYSQAKESLDKHEYPDTDHSTKNTNGNKRGLPDSGSMLVTVGQHLTSALRFPWLGVALIILTIALVLPISHRENDPASSETFVSNAVATNVISSRPRPNKTSIFVSALTSDTALEKQLNSVISGVLAQSDDIEVYRSFTSQQTLQYWPEDYFLALQLLPLQRETRVNIQVINANTGKVVYVDSLSLRSNAITGLTKDELDSLTNLSEQIRHSTLSVSSSKPMDSQ